MNETLNAIRALLDIPLIHVGSSVLRLGAVAAMLGVLIGFEVLIRALERAITRHFDADAEEPDEKMPVYFRRLVRWPLSVIGLFAAIRIAGLNPKVLVDFFNLPLFTIRGTPLTPSGLATFAALVLLTWWLSRLAQRGATEVMKRRKVYEEGTIAVTRRLVHYAVMLIGLGVALETVGIDLSVLFAAGAVFAVGIGFALQNIVENFISGLLLLVEGAIKPGDVVDYGGEIVKVRRMNIRTTVVQTLDNENIIVPNSSLAQSAVRNLTYDSPLHRVRTVVGVSYESDMARVEAVLIQAAMDHPMRDPQHEPIVSLLQFGSSSVDWEVSVHINQPFSSQNARSLLNKSIWWALKGAKITIAYPQLDVHMIPPPRAGGS